MLSHALEGLVGEGEATSVLLMRREVQRRFGIRGVRQGDLAMTCAHKVGGQIPLVGEDGGGRAQLLIKHGCGVGEEAGAGVGVCEVSAGVGERVMVGLTLRGRAGVGKRVALEMGVGMGVGVRAQVGVRLCVVMVSFVRILDEL